jgi:hypothetical protein
MERNRNWPAWIALVLAGLALFVALGGRGPGFGNRWNDGPVVLQAPAAPGNVQGMPFERELNEELRGGPGHGFYHERGADMMNGRGFGPGYGYRDGWHGHGFGFFGPLAFLAGLGKLIGLGLLAWLLFRWWNNRRNQPVATTPAGHDPRVE